MINNLNNEIKKCIFQTGRYIFFVVFGYVFKILKRKIIYFPDRGF